MRNATIVGLNQSLGYRFVRANPTLLQWPD